MVTLYEGLLFLHILLAVVWVGGGAIIQLYALRALGTNDPARLAGFAKDTEWVATRTFTPAGLLLVASGIWLVEEGSWGFDHFWIAFGLAVYAASFLSGALFIGPELGRIGKLVDEHGVEHPDVQARIKRIFVISRVELVFLIAVVFDMTIKPSF